MINEKNKTVEEDSVTTVNVDDSDCQAKMEKLNKKLQETANELEEISSLYAKSVKESLDKSKKN
ncbi:MAG: Chromosome partition protein Smc [Spiroplasma endosymbiont of Drosophila atripex]|nr:MAG: Chromosome partition protein Smc [Spiroplasma endosymbiont of Drosophila atripex]